MNQYNYQVAARMEAAQEAEAREIRKVINFQNQWCSRENDVAKRQARHENAEWDRRKNRRECEARKHANIRAFLWRNFWCVLLGAVIFALDLLSLIDFWCVLVGVVLIGAYLSLNFVAYALRNFNPFEDLTETTAG